MNEAAADLEALKRAQPSWMAEGIGLRPNQVEAQREQTRVEWPAATFERRAGRDLAGPASAGAPELPPSVPAG